MARHSTANVERAQRLAQELKGRLAPLAALIRKRPEVVWGWNGKTLQVEVALRDGIWREVVAYVLPLTDTDPFEKVFVRAWNVARGDLREKLAREGHQKARSAAYRRREVEELEAEGRVLRETARGLATPAYLWKPDVE